MKNTIAFALLSSLLLGTAHAGELGRYPVTIQAADGRYLVAPGDGELNADSESAGLDELFTLIERDDGTFNLQAPDGKYVVAEHGAPYADTNANRDNASTWERFDTPGANTIFGVPTPIVTYHSTLLRQIGDELENEAFMSVRARNEFTITPFLFGARFLDSGGHTALSNGNTRYTGDIELPIGQGELITLRDAVVTWKRGDNGVFTRFQGSADAPELAMNGLAGLLGQAPGGRVTFGIRNPHSSWPGDLMNVRYLRIKRTDAVQWGPIGIAPASNGRSTWIVDHDTAEVHVHGTITMGGFTAVGWVSVSDGPDFDLQTRGLTHTIDGVTFTAAEANLDLDLATLAPVAADAHGAMAVTVQVNSNQTANLVLSDALLVVEAGAGLALDGVLEDGAPLQLPRGVHFDDARGTVVAQGTVDGGQTQAGSLVVTVTDVALGDGNALARASTIDADLTVNLAVAGMQATGRIWLSGGDINLNWSSSDWLNLVNEHSPRSSVMVDSICSFTFLGGDRVPVYAAFTGMFQWYPGSERLVIDWPALKCGGREQPASQWDFHSVVEDGETVFGVTRHYSSASIFHNFKAR